MDAEQTATHRPAARSRIWDYSARNAEAIVQAVPGARVRVVEGGYVPEFARVVHRPFKDIDVLFYGQPSERPLAVLNELAAAGLAVQPMDAPSVHRTGSQSTFPIGIDRTKESWTLQILALDLPVSDASGGCRSFIDIDRIRDDRPAQDQVRVPPARGDRP